MFIYVAARWRNLLCGTFIMLCYTTTNKAAAHYEVTAQRYRRNESLRYRYRKNHNDGEVRRE